MPRRAAHWVQTVTVPPASTAASRSGSGAECGSSNSSARPGTASQADSPVSHNETRAPAATAVAATVNACAHRSGASVPAVALTTSVRAMGDSIGSTPRGCGDRPAPEDRRCHGHRDRVRRPAGGRVRPARRRAGLPGREGGAGRMSQALPPPWLDAPPVTPYPYRDSHDPAGGGPDPHPAVLALLPFVGLWRGRGRGGYPTIEEFDYGQEIRISHDGRPFLAYESRAW